MLCWWWGSGGDVWIRTDSADVHHLDRAESTVGVMGISDLARDKAQAKVSEAQAAVTSLTARLQQAQADLAATEAAGDLWESVQDTPVVGSLTSGMRSSATVNQAEAQAEVDRLQAELTAAQNKLDWAKKAQSAVESVTGE